MPAVRRRGTAAGLPGGMRADEARYAFPAVAGAADRVLARIAADRGGAVGAGPDWVLIFTLISTLLPMLAQCAGTDDSQTEDQKLATMYYWLTRPRLLWRLRDNAIRAAVLRHWDAPNIAGYRVADAVVDESYTVGRQDLKAAVAEIARLHAAQEQT